MVSINEFQFIKEQIFNLSGVSTDAQFHLVKSEGVFVSYDGKNAEICGCNKADTARALTIFAKNIKEGRKTFSINEKRHFETLGFWLDVSRNGVMKVEKVKEYIKILASLGFNALTLYMEDVFELEGYPYFGYRRGRYTIDELKSIDDYAFQMGIDVIPSIQTLGHLAQYLRWAEAKDIKENKNVLLCGEEKTYVFIEKVISTMRKAFRTKRIGLGCDEAAGVGLGNYLNNHSYTDANEIISNHLVRVNEICKKYDFNPIVCGDLYLKYYDFEQKVDLDKIGHIPDVDIMYWDYYHTEEEDYKILLDMHRKLGKHIMFSGGIWTWCGQLPNTKFTFDTMTPALNVALDEKLDDVWALTFGDDGNETSAFFAVPSLCLFSEKCFKGKDCTETDICGMAEFITGVSFDKFMALSNYHYPFVEGLEKREYIWPNYMGKKIFYTDVFYNFTNTYDFSVIKPEHIEGYNKVRNSATGTKWEIYFNYAQLIYEISILKIDAICDIKSAYAKKDKSMLQKYAENILPEIIKKYELLHSVHEKIWLNENKAMGWEELDCRYGGIIARLKYAIRTISKYVNNEINAIQELECEFIEDAHGSFPYGGVAIYNDIRSTSLPFMPN